MKLFLSAILIIWSLTAAAQTNPAYPPPGELIDVGGYRLHLKCTGDKAPTVVLINGAGDFSFD